MPSPIVKALWGSFIFLPHIGEAWEALLSTGGAFLKTKTKAGESNPDKETLRGLCLEQTAQKPLILSVGITFSSPVALDNILPSTLIYFEREGLCTQFHCSLITRNVGVTSARLC